MTKANEESGPSKDIASPSRRWVIGSAAIGAAAGVAADLGSGVALADGAKSPAAPERIGVRRFEGKVVLVTGGTSGIGRLCGRRENLGLQVIAPTIESDAHDETTSVGRVANEVARRPTARSTTS